MRSRQSALAVCAVLLPAVLGSTAACSANDSGPSAAVPIAPVEQQPAAAAGGACILLDFGQIEEKLGVHFDVAAADAAGVTSTCVVQAEGSTRPDLVFSVLERTAADAGVFLATVKPEKGEQVDGLGAAAYRVVHPPVPGAGPAVEIGWLTKDQQAKTLLFTFPANPPAPDGEKLADRLVELGKALESVGQ